MKPRNTSSAVGIILPDKLSNSEARVLSFDPSSWTDGDVTVARASGGIGRRERRGMKGKGEEGREEKRREKKKKKNCSGRAQPMKRRAVKYSN